MASSKLSLKFRIYKNNELVGVRELNQSVIKIGKVPTAHVHLEDESVSRMHAIVEVLGDTAHIIDLGSTRGTFVNGARINKAKLTSGDLVQCGDMRLEVMFAEGTAPEAAKYESWEPETPKPAPPPVPKAAPAHVLKAPTPVAPTFMTTPAAPAAFAALAEEPGARAVEVATMLGDSVVDVKHCMDPKSGKVTPATWGFLAGGLACLLTSAAAFYVSVDTAAQNKASLNYHVNVLKKPAYSHRPKQVGAGVDYLAFGGLAFGLLGMTAGLARARSEKKSPYYRIGTAPGVEQPVENAPAADFPMVAPSGDDFVFNYGAGMDGELILDGKSTPLSDLASQGLARQSASIAGAIEVPIPAKAKIRARAGQTTFLVSAVNKPAKQAAPLFNIERRTAAYVAGSLAVHLGIIAFLATVPVDASGVQVTFNTQDGVDIKSALAEKDDVPEKIEEKDNGEGAPSEGGGKMALEEGQSGHPDKPNQPSHIRIKNNGEEKAMSREEAIAQARDAGILGSTQLTSGGLKALAGQADFSSGFDGADVYGALIGADGEGQGVFGGGRYGMGPGGGCLGGECGIIGTGRYKTIGNGPGAGPGGWGPGGSGNGPWRRHDAGPPKVEISMPHPTDGLDKAIIKRYVKRQTAKISYCYETELLVKPSLEGVVNVQFMITSAGTVSMSTGAGMDTKVANCVANVVKNIEFPKPTNGGNVQVNYPFTFRAAGK